ncbi:hypothetical protein GB931_03630 [Modestobacter sp. I12A-02628]|uniref:Uncharacterized protein n=1 Tax=Goekera deserti TaxID=2497753 RepID=A0A7K3WCV5_9ACTN|nr:hypothetical protein [Goekera deserti]MPQ97029.1 hypothetical protein [Goekera deserti]NDI46655.1 hypothetical protein [Goekera deserti]NEL54224.1 hypothetical protein [Goekera deserti]
MTVPTFSYDSEGVRQGGRTAVQASDQEAAATATLSGATVPGGAFGGVSQAGGLAGALESARSAHAAAAQVTTANLQTQGDRAAATADLGDDNEAATTSLAPRKAQAGAVSQGM